jgi:hypothetical protein
VKPPYNCDAAGDGRSGIAALVEVGDVVPDPIKADIAQPEAVLVESGEIAGEIVGVGVESAGAGTELSRERIEPQLSEPSVGAHGILLVCEAPGTTNVTYFLSKHVSLKLMGVGASLRCQAWLCNGHLQGGEPDGFVSAIYVLHHSD